jgi:hypothetical protein
MKSVPSATIVAENATRLSSACVKIGSFFLLGGRRMMTWSSGSTPSEMMLMNRVYIGFSGAALPTSVLIDERKRGRRRRQLERKKVPDVVEDRLALCDRGDERAEYVVDEDDVRRLLRDVHPGGDECARAWGRE